MADSLMDFGNIAQLAQNQLRNTISMAHLGMQEEQMGIQRDRVDLDRQRLQVEEQRMRQHSTFKAFDEMEKLAMSPSFATPQQQVKLRMSQANLMKMGLGVDLELPSEEEMLGNAEHFAENLKLYRQGADPGTRQAAFERMVTSMPDYGKKLMDTLKDEGQLDARGEELRMKLELHGPKLAALQQKSGRVALQQGLFSEHMGAIAQTVALGNHPKFQAHLNKLQGMNETARAIYLKTNPEFQREFTNMVKPHLEKLGAVGPEFEEALGEDVRPGVLRALDEEIDVRLQAKNEAIERDGVAPVELGEELSGMELVRKARTVQYAWMRDPFSKEKFKAMQKAQQDIRIAHDATGKTLASIQSDRMGLMQQKFDAGQQEKLASDYAFEVFRQKLKEGHGEDDAAVLAGKSVAEKYPNTPYGADKLKTHKPLVENITKVSMTQEKEEAKKVGGGFGDQYIDLQKADIASRDKLSKYDRMDQLLGQINTGKLEPAKTSIQAVAESLGVSVDKSLPSKQAFQALSNEIALTLRNPSGGAGMPGALSDKDREFLQSMTPDLGKTAEGNKLIIDTARKIAKRDQEVAKMAREYRKKRGQFDEGFFDQLAAYSEKNQLFKQAAQPTKATTQKQGGAVLKALPQGSKQIGTSGGKPVYQDANGKRWIGE